MKRGGPGRLRDDAAGWSSQLWPMPPFSSVLQVIVHEVPGQEVEVEVFDKDPDKDDFLGR